MNFATQQTDDTEAVITVIQKPPLAAKNAVYGSDSNQLKLVNTVSFSYSSDCLQLGDPFTVTIPNPRGQYTDKFFRGQTVELYLRNPNVLGNQPTLKHTGIITRRRQSCSGSGTVIQLTCNDLGWHLANNDAPLWYVLDYAKLVHLLQDERWIDPSWGFKGIRISNAVNRSLRQNVNNGRAQAQLDQAALGTLVHIQVEVGDKVADQLTEYCRRMNRLLSVSCDGYLQVWLPDYDREPLFRLELHDLSDPARNRNAVLDCFVEEDLAGIYTNITCVGEMVGGDLALDPADQNASKRRGDFVNEWALPFRRRMGIADGNIFERNEARLQAEWAYNRGIFDSWQAVYVVRGHWQRPAGSQRAYWWESDQMVAINDSVNGLFGTFWISAVRCDRDDNGDRTFITVRKPCLQASFGQYKRPPRILGSPIDTHGPSVTTTTKTTVTGGG